MNEILNLLGQRNVAYQLVHHPAVYTAEEADRYVTNYDFTRDK